MQIGGCLCGLRPQGWWIAFSRIFIILDIPCQELVNMCQLNILVLNIFCQQLGDIRQFDDVFAPFGHSVGEREFFRVYICIVHTLPTIVEYVSAEYTYWYWIYSANNWEIYDSWMMLGNVHFLEFACIIYPPDIPYLFPRYCQDITRISQ